MFKIYKDEDGKLICRPMLIGFIANNATRRTMMILMWIPTLSVAISLNLMFLLLAFSIGLIRFVRVSLKMLVRPPWKDKFWESPRIK